MNEIQLLLLFCWPSVWEKLQLTDSANTDEALAQYQHHIACRAGGLEGMNMGLRSFQTDMHNPQDNVYFPWLEKKERTLAAWRKENA